MPGDEPSPPTNSNAHDVVVTLVHGTFARGTAWVQEGSVLRQWITQSVERDANRVIFDIFEWSGQNSHRARVKAGYELAEHIRHIRKHHPNCRHFIVAHSHGGNVALLAQKHLPEDQHALGIATLGTPFVYAQLDESIRGKSIEQLLDEAPRHTDLISGFGGWVIGVPSAIWFSDAAENTGFDVWYWVLGAGVAAGITGSMVLGYLWPPVAKLWHHFSGKPAALRLANAVQFGAMPKTHVLSFIYPGDEAGRLLDTLEITTSLPSRAIRWVRSAASIGFGAVFLGIIVLAIVSAIVEEFVAFDGDAFADWIAEWFAILMTTTIFVWVGLVVFRYVASFLRGHPWGFGWELPSIHAHVDIGVQPKANIPQSKSYLHQEVPYSVHAPRKGMRHVGLYEDQRILQAISYWMAHVK